MPEFHETGFGHIFFNQQLPELIRQIKRVGDGLEKMNKNYQESVANIAAVITRLERIETMVQRLAEERGVEVPADYISKSP